MGSSAVQQQAPQLLSQGVQKSAGRCSRGLGSELGEAFWESTLEVVQGAERWALVFQPGRLNVPLEEGVFSGSGVGLAGLGSASWLSVHPGTGPVSSGLHPHPHLSAVFFPTSTPQEFLLLTLQLRTLSAFLPLWEKKTARLRGVEG